MAMRIRYLDTPSNEAIALQSGRLFQELTEAFTALRKSSNLKTASIRDAGFREIVLTHTNMAVELSIVPDSMTACIHWPQIDRNHPFIAQYSKMFLFGSDTGLTLIRSMGGAIQGAVDTKNCKVSGIYTKIQGEIFFGERLVNDKRYTDSELAAIFLHEVGHLFTYFEYLGSVVVTSHMMSYASKLVYEIEDYDTRVKVMKEAERTLGIEINDKEKIAAMPKRARGVAAETIMINANAEKTRSETGLSVYELRSAEQLADQFAAYHGAGRDLVTALDKLFKQYMMSSTLNTTEHTMLEIVKLMLFITSLVVIPVPTIVWLLFYNPTKKIYDDLEARVRLVRQMINNQLKDKDLSKDIRKGLLEDLEAIQVVEAGLDDKRTLLELLWTTIIPSGRAALSQQETMKHLEALMNNDLFAISAKFAASTEDIAKGKSGFFR